MDPKDQKKITKNLLKIRKTIAKDVTTITERLVEEGIFSKTVLEETKGVHPTLPHLQCGILINNLMRAGSAAYGVFKKVLEELGYTSLVDAMENSCAKVDVTKSKPAVREQTFIVQTHKVPDRLSKSMSQSFSEKSNHEVDIDEMTQLERMMTVVLSTKDRTGSGNADFRKEFRNRLAEESRESGELAGLFKTLRHNSVALPKQTCVH